MKDLRAFALAALITLVLVLVCRSLPMGHGAMPGACQTPQAEACAGSVGRLLEVGGANPCMAVCVRFGGFRTAMCIDTGFAGPCLLSLPCLATAPAFPADDRSDADCTDWCRRAQSALGDVSATRQEAALQAFVRQERCSTFTSGCTMRLASIGTTKESTSDVVLAPPLELRTPDGRWTSPRACSGQPVAEVLTSTPMATLHLLTCDWLAQNAPALIAPHEGVLRTNLDAAAFAREQSTLRSVSTEMSGGAFVATIRVEGVPMRVTVDTGAACYLSIGKRSAEKLRTCRATGKTMRQVGANGERICSHAVLAHVEMGGATEEVPVLVNNMDLDSEDGYLGFCYLRHYDLCVTPDTLYARRNPSVFDPTLLDATLSTKGGCPDALPACAATSSSPEQ